MKKYEEINDTAISSDKIADDNEGQAFDKLPETQFESGTVSGNDTANYAAKNADIVETVVDAIETDSAELEKSKHWKGRITGFLLGQAASIFGSMLVQHAMIFYLTLTYNSGVIMMISSLCAFLPQIAVSIFSGVFADRMDRKKLIIFSDSLMAAVTLILALIFMSGYRELWLIFGVMAVRSLCSGIQSPAVSALLPQITPKAKLNKINGINGSIQSLAMLVSPVLAAMVLAVFNIEIIFFIDVVTAFGAVMILISIHVPKLERGQKNTGYFDDLKSGLKYIAREKPLKSFLLFWTLVMFLLTPVMILPPIHISRAFGGGELYLAINEVGFALGALISGIAISAWGGFKSRLKTLFFGCLIFSVFTFLMGFGGNTFAFIFGRPVANAKIFFWIFVSLTFLSGAGLPFANVPGMTLIQEYVEPSMHGRVFGLLQIISAAAVPVGSLIFGPLADVVNIEIIFIISGVMLLLLCILMAFNKNIKRIEINQSHNNSVPK